MRKGHRYYPFRDDPDFRRFIARYIRSMRKLIRKEREKDVFSAGCGSFRGMLLGILLVTGFPGSLPSWCYYRPGAKLPNLYDLRERNSKDMHVVP